MFRSGDPKPMVGLGDRLTAHGMMLRGSGCTVRTPSASSPMWCNHREIHIYEGLLSPGNRTAGSSGSGTGASSVTPTVVVRATSGPGRGPTGDYGRPVG